MRGSNIRRTRQSAGKFTRATTGGISVFGPLPASTTKPPRSNNAAPTPERAPRSSRRASPRASSGSPANDETPRRSPSPVESRSRARHGRGSRFRDDELFRTFEAETFGDAKRKPRAPLALLAQRFKARGFAKLNGGLERVDGEYRSSRTPAEVAVEIEKTQMQARRRRNPYAFQLRASLQDHSPAFRLARFDRNIAKLCARLPSAGCEKSGGAPFACGGSTVDLAEARQPRRGGVEMLWSPGGKCHSRPMKRRYEYRLSRWGDDRADSDGMRAQRAGPMPKNSDCSLFRRGR